MRFVRIASAASIPSRTGPTIQKRASAHPRGEHCLRDHRTGRVAILRELPAPSSGDFGWGYNGSGLNWAAKAVLADALKLSDPGRIGIGPGREDSTLSLLRQDFCWDVTTQLCDELRMRRGSVLRWVRGWYAEHGIADLPAAAVQPPPANPRS